MNQSTMVVALVGLASGFKSDPIGKTLPPDIRLSWELLCFVSVEGRILSSFTDFITTPEIPGPFYISQAVYHTQIAEYSLETLYQCGNNLRRALFYLG
jgi:hypothetical protein